MPDLARERGLDEETETHQLLAPLPLHLVRRRVTRATRPLLAQTHAVRPEPSPAPGQLDLLPARPLQLRTVCCPLETPAQRGTLRFPLWPKLVQLVCKAALFALQYFSQLKPHLQYLALLPADMRLLKSLNWPFPRKHRTSPRVTLRLVRPQRAHPVICSLAPRTMRFHRTLAEVPDRNLHYVTTPKYSDKQCLAVHSIRRYVSARPD